MVSLKIVHIGAVDASYLESNVCLIYGLYLCDAYYSYTKVSPLINSISIIVLKVHKFFL